MKPLHSYVGQVFTPVLRAEMEAQYGVAVHTVTPGSGINPAMTGPVLKLSENNVILDTTVL